MQVNSGNQDIGESGGKIEELAGKFEDDFSLKLDLNEDTVEEDEEFSFVCTNPDGSPISADDIFQNGQIRPVYPLFDRNLLFLDDELEDKNPSELRIRPPLKKLFLEEIDRASTASSSEAEEPEGPYCSWTSKASDASPEACKKSNSTGSSKLRRFRELVLRSNSDGKDAFVFLHHDHHSHRRNHSTIKATTAAEKTSKAEKSEKAKEEKQIPTTKKGSKKPSTSVHERLYMRNREMKEENKRKTYLPYRVGFFTNVNGLSRNVHPY